MIFCAFISRFEPSSAEWFLDYPEDPRACAQVPYRGGPMGGQGAQNFRFWIGSSELYRKKMLLLQGHPRADTNAFRIWIETVCMFIVDRHDRSQ